MNTKKYKDMMDKMKMTDQIDQEIKSSVLSHEKNKRTIRFKKAIYAIGSVAAVFAIVLTVGITNPAMAKKIPLIGYIFEDVREDVNYKGDYRGIGTQLKDENNKDKYQKASEGITINLSEVYCNKQALYILLEINTKEKLPETENLQLFTEEQYSFSSNVKYDALEFEGHKVDDHTYVGLVRLNLNEKIDDMNDLPNSFGLDLKVEKIKGLLSDVVFDENASEGNEYVVLNGPWNFNLNVDVNLDDTVEINLKDRAKDGLGFSSIIKDRFELTVYSLADDPLNFGEYIPVVLNADGRVMSVGGSGLVNTYAIGNEDTSYVELFLFDGCEWLDDIKTNYWITSEGLTDKNELAAFRKTMLNRCKYYTKVEFEK